MSAAIDSQSAELSKATDAAQIAWQALDASDDIVLLIEVAGDPAASVVIACNGAFRRSSGFPDTAVVGRPVVSLFPVPDQAEAIVQAIRNQTSTRAEFACARADGKTFILGFHLMPAPGRSPVRPCEVDPIGWTGIGGS
jgi:PAS domain-containing protein